MEAVSKAFKLRVAHIFWYAKKRLCIKHLAEPLNTFANDIARKAGIDQLEKTRLFLRVVGERKDVCIP
jgi:hypothetical protein